MPQKLKTLQDFTFGSAAPEVPTFASNNAYEPEALSMLAIILIGAGALACLISIVCLCVFKCKRGGRLGSGNEDDEAPTESVASRRYL